jgi:hypothetical protein
MAETDIQPERVEQEHLQSANEPAHWAYLVGVLLLGLVLMLLLIAWMGASAG